MPIANADQSIRLQLFMVHESVTCLGAQDSRGHFCLDRGDVGVADLRKCLVIRKLDPHEIDRQQEAFFASFDRSHQSDIEFRQNVTGTGMDAGRVPPRTNRAMNPGKPQIGADCEVPVIIVRGSCYLRNGTASCLVRRNQIRRLLNNAGTQGTKASIIANAKV